MDFVQTRELSLEYLEEELDRVKKAKEITEKFLNSLNSLSEQKVTELENLKANLSLLKDLDNKKSKENFLIELEKREKNMGKAIDTMKTKGLKTYDPREVEWDSN